MLGVDALAQVTVGGSDIPKSYEILKINSMGADGSGLRLPRYSTAQLTSLESTLSGNPKANGLMCFDSTLKKIVVWDGTKWVTILNYEYLNGITLTADKKLELGGTLVENTTIATDANNLEFTTSGGTFKINEDHFAIINNALSVGSATSKVDFKLNDGFARTGADDRLLIASDNQGLSVATVRDTATLFVNDTLATFSRSFTHNVNTSSFDTRMPIVMTASSTTGEGQWTSLTNSATNKIIPTLTTSYDWNTVLPVNTWTPISSTFKLDSQGKWLVMGRFRLYTKNGTTGGSNKNYNTYLAIYNKTKGTRIYISSQLPERKAGTGPLVEPYGAYCSPSLCSFIDVTAANINDEYEIQYFSKMSAMYFTTIDWIGKEYLNAVQIRKDD